MDWEIKARIVNVVAQGDTLYGSCSKSVQNKTAVIKIVSAESAKDFDCDFEYDMLVTVVHEILHIKMHILDDIIGAGGMSGMLAEQLVDDMAKIIVELLRRSLEDVGDCTGEETGPEIED